ILLLPAPYPADPRACACSVMVPARHGGSMAVHEPSDGNSAGAREICLEPRSPLSRVCGRRHDPVFPVPLVRGAQGAEQGPLAMAELRLEAVAGLFDIHGNLPALEAVLEEVRRAGVDQVIVGGDVVPGPMPNETVRRLLDLDLPVRFIHGNC